MIQFGLAAGVTSALALIPSLRPLSPKMLRRPNRRYADHELRRGASIPLRLIRGPGRE
jgi:hypothetical protein